MGFWIAGALLLGVVLILRLRLTGRRHGRRKGDGDGNLVWTDGDAGGSDGGDGGGD